MWSVVILLLLLGRAAVGAEQDEPASAGEATDTLPPVSKLLDTYECTRCHRLTTPHRLIGPSLWNLGQRADAAEIRASILTPDAVLVPGYPAGLMRARLEEIGFYRDVARQPAILDRLVAFLAGAHVVTTPTVHVTPDTTGMVHIPPTAALPGFSIDATPVTNSQYATFIAAGGYHTKSYWERAGWAIVVQRNKRTQPLEWSTRAAQSPEAPVVGVSWYEADAYCRWAGKTMPSELQWQRACLAVPDWSGATEAAAPQWEWTAEALWKGRAPEATHPQEYCLARTPSYPALDNLHTGFRCRAHIEGDMP